MKKIPLCFSPLLTYFVLLLLWQHPSFATKQLVAITQIVEHPALNETRQGIFDELQQQGFNDTCIKILYQNAQGNLTTAAQIAQHLAAQNPAVFVAISTPSTLAAKRICEYKNIPLVFASVTDPYASHLLEEGKESHSITGVSNYIDVKEQLDYFLLLIPSLKTIGIVYNPGEINSTTLLQKFEHVAKNNGIKILSTPAYRTGEVPSALQHLVGKVDAIFVHNDNTVLSAFDTVARIGQEHAIPILCSDTDFVKQKALAAVGCNQYQLGRQVGCMVARILRERSIQKMPVEWPQAIERHLNIQQMQLLGLELLPQARDATTKIHGAKQDDQ